MTTGEDVDPDLRARYEALERRELAEMTENLRRAVAARESGRDEGAGAEVGGVGMVEFWRTSLEDARRLSAEFHEAIANDPERANRWMRRRLSGQADLEAADAAAHLDRSRNESLAAMERHGPFSPEALDASGRVMRAQVAADAAEEAASKAKADQQVGRRLRGCSPTVMAVIGVIIAVVIGVVVLVTGDDDGSSDDQSSNATSEIAGGTVAASTSGGDGSDVSAFAGRYELIEGLQNPNGQDTQPIDASAWSITPNPAQAWFEVDESGTVTGGEIHTSFVAVGGIGTCTWKLDGATASGSIVTSGPGATGDLTFIGEVTATGPCATTPLPATRIARIGIVGNEAVLCYVGVSADLTSCSAQDPGIAARFTRR